MVAMSMAAAAEEVGYKSANDAVDDAPSVFAACLSLPRGSKYPHLASLRFAAAPSWQRRRQHLRTDLGTVSLLA